MKHQLFLHELHPHPTAGQLALDTAKVVEVASQTVHRVHHHGVTVTDEGQQPRQLRPRTVLTRSMIGELPIQLNAGQLPDSVRSRLLTLT